MSTTIWTSVIDATARRYYFQDTRTPNIVWVDLDRFEFASGQPPRRLDLSGHPVLQGEVSARFEPAEPYVFLGARR